MAAVVASGRLDSRAPAVYALSFWHYLLYWWAYRRGTVGPRRFRRDAVLMKAVALVVFFVAYAEAAWSWPSVLVMAAGFGLNGLAALVLGLDRTYYGWELGDVPHHRVTAFPFSVVPHPMLSGNAMAYAGALLNAEFRDAWWPLATAHLLLNAGLLCMETFVVPHRGDAVTAARQARRDRRLEVNVPVSVTRTAAGGALTGASLATAVEAPAHAATFALLGAAVGMHLAVTAEAYTRPRDRVLYP